MGFLEFVIFCYLNFFCFCKKKSFEGRGNPLGGHSAKNLGHIGVWVGEFVEMVNSFYAGTRQLGQLQARAVAWSARRSTEATPIIFSMSVRLFALTDTQVGRRLLYLSSIIRNTIERWYSVRVCPDKQGSLKINKPQFVYRLTMLNSDCFESNESRRSSNNFAPLVQRMLGHFESFHKPISL